MVKGGMAILKMVEGNKTVEWRIGKRLFFAFWGESTLTVKKPQEFYRIPARTRSRDAQWTVPLDTGTMQGRTMQG